MIALAALVAIAGSCVVSASAGLGGSLILVPVLGLVFGAKQGIAMAALLLGCNNIAKVAVYRRTIPLRAAAAVTGLTIAGSAVGAGLLVHAPEIWVRAGVAASITLAFLLERTEWTSVNRKLAGVLAFSAGTTSGFTGTSGPLKGMALRSLGLDRLHFVGAASVVSLAGDAVKAAVLVAGAAVLDRRCWTIVLAAIPLMPLAALMGRRISGALGERAYAGLFWGIMGAYVVRLVLA